MISRSQALKPGAGGTTPMFAGAGSVITAAIRPGCAAKAASSASRSLYGTTIVCAAVASVTPADPGSPWVATPEPAAASRPSECPW